MRNKTLSRRLDKVDAAMGRTRDLTLDSFYELQRALEADAGGDPEPLREHCRHLGMTVEDARRLRAEAERNVREWRRETFQQTTNNTPKGDPQ